MGTVPNDFKESLGRLIVICLLSTDPAQSLKHSRSVMTMTKAGLMKKNDGKLDAEFLKNFVEWRATWDTLAAQFASDSTTWNQTMGKVADILDFFVPMCLVEDLISISSQDISFSDLFLNRRPIKDEDENDNR